MSNDTQESWSLKKVMDLHRGIGLLHTPDMMNKLLTMGPLSDDVKELIELGLAASAAQAALEKRLAEHQAAYDATLPLRLFQTYEAVYNGDGTWDEDIKHGVYEARTEKQAIALAHGFGETAATHAHQLSQSAALAYAARNSGMEVVELKVEPDPLSVEAMGGFPKQAPAQSGKVESELERSDREYNEEIEMRTRVFGAPD